MASWSSIEQDIHSLKPPDIMKETEKKNHCLFLLGQSYNPALWHINSKVQLLCQSLLVLTLAHQLLYCHRLMWNDMPHLHRSELLVYLATFSYILYQIPSAADNTFLNNSKPTECRLIPFKPWLDKCHHLIFEFERSVWFHARAFAFCLMVLPFEKVTKKKAETNHFQFCFTSCKCFVFVICRHFTTLKWLKVLKLSKICLKTAKAMTPKNNRSEHFVSQWKDTIQFKL